MTSAICPVPVLGSLIVLDARGALWPGVISDRKIVGARSLAGESNAQFFAICRVLALGSLIVLDARGAL